MRKRSETALAAANLAAIRRPNPSFVRLVVLSLRGNATRGRRETSPLGTTFINFGGEYPNQRFAGFIAAGSRIGADQRLTMIQGKTISITGIIELYKGKPEITVVSGDQIKGFDSLH
jgi:hypothetical protein